MKNHVLANDCINIQQYFTRVCMCVCAFAYVRAFAYITLSALAHKLKKVRDSIQALPYCVVKTTQVNFPFTFSSGFVYLF